jgi:hypothetical protein
MFVTIINNFWRHGDIDLTGRYANMRKIYARAAIIGVILAAVASTSLPCFAPRPRSIRTSISTAWTSSTTSSASW